MTSSVVQGQHPLLTCAATVHSALDEVRGVEPLYMSTGEKERAVLELERAERRLMEARLRVLAVCGDVADRHSARDVAAWYAHSTRSEPGKARADVELAKALDSDRPQVRAAMATGTASAEQAGVITRCLADLPTDLGEETIASAETLLVQYAAEHRPSALRRIGRHILDVAAPDIAEEEDAKRLEQEERAAREKASLRFRNRGDGTTSFTGVLPDAAAARWKTYLEAYTSPRRRQDGPLGWAGEVDRIPAHRRLAHAFTALLEHLDPDQLPEHGGDATTVMITLSHEQLLADLAAAGLVDADLEAGPNLTAGQARRLACTANIIPVVLGADSEILDLGRARRLFTPAIRKAIRLRDKRCRAEGCTIPATWCEAHHLTPWSRGGPTSIANAVSLCSHHHHRIHDRRYGHQRRPDGDVRFHRRT